MAWSNDWCKLIWHIYKNVRFPVRAPNKLKMFSCWMNNSPFHNCTQIVVTQGTKLHSWPPPIQWCNEFCSTFKITSKPFLFFIEISLNQVSCARLHLHKHDSWYNWKWIKRLGTCWKLDHTYNLKQGYDKKVDLHMHELRISCKHIT